MRRHRADNSRDIVFSVNDDRLSRKQTSVDAAELVELDKALVGDVSHDEAYLVYVCIEHKKRLVVRALTEEADDVAAFYLRIGTISAQERQSKLSRRRFASRSA